MSEPSNQRPDLQEVVSALDVTRWYWTRAELVEIARNHSVSTGGSKTELQTRIIAILDGKTRIPKKPRAKTTDSHRLTPPFTVEMLVPAGQPFTRELREWMTQQLGRELHVTQTMRDFMKNPQDKTLGDLLLLAKQRPAKNTIPQQFELNRFMRVLSLRQPALTHVERMAAWREFRLLPSADREKFLGSFQK